MNIRKEPNKFQRWCMEHSYTAHSIAEKIGISPYTVYSYFAGERLPSRRTMKLMEEKLGIDARKLFE